MENKDAVKENIDEVTEESVTKSMDTDTVNLYPEKEDIEEVTSPNTYTVSDFDNNTVLYTPPVSGYTSILTFTQTINDESNIEAIQNPAKKRDTLYYSSLMNTINGNTKVVSEDPFSNLLSNGLFVNGLEYGDKTIKPKKLNATNSNSESAILAKISKSLASGENIQMPLMHSGIWITIKPPTSTELSILKRNLDKNRIKIGRETGGLLYSNKNITLYKIAVDFILSKCINTTLELEENDDIRDYIFVEDIPLMILTIAMSLYPNGFKTTIGCANNSIFNEDKKEPLCNFLETAVMDLETLLRIDKRRIDNFMLETLANRKPGSVSKVRLEEYRKHVIKHTKDISTTKVTTETDENIVLEYASVNLTIYFYRGQLWIDRISKSIEELVIDSDEDKDDLIDDLITTSILGIYNTFVSAIHYDGEIHTDDNIKLKILESMSSDDNIYSEFFAGVKRFLGEAPIAIVATTNFICPTCKTERKPKTVDGNWDNFIVLDPLNYFLDLIALRLLYKMKR